MNYCRKSILQSWTPFMTKTFRKLRIEGNFFSLIKNMYRKHTVYVILDERMNTLLLWLGTRCQGCPFSLHIYTIVLEVPASIIRQEKKKGIHTDWKGRNETVSFFLRCDCMHRKLQIIYKKICRTNKWVQQDHRIQGQHTKSRFLYSCNVEIVVKNTSTVCNCLKKWNT